MTVMKEIVALDNALDEVINAGHNIISDDDNKCEDDWERLIKAAEDILKIAGAR